MVERSLHKAMVVGPIPTPATLIITILTTKYIL